MASAGTVLLQEEMKDLLSSDSLVASLCASVLGTAHMLTVPQGRPPKQRRNLLGSQVPPARPGRSREISCQNTSRPNNAPFFAGCPGPPGHWHGLGRNKYQTRAYLKHRAVLATGTVGCVTVCACGFQTHPKKRMQLNLCLAAFITPNRLLERYDQPTKRASLPSNCGTPTLFTILKLMGPAALAAPSQKDQLPCTTLN